MKERFRTAALQLTLSQEYVTIINACLPSSAAPILTSLSFTEDLSYEKAIFDNEPAGVGLCRIIAPILSNCAMPALEHLALTSIYRPPWPSMNLSTFLKRLRIEAIFDGYADGTGEVGYADALNAMRSLPHLEHLHLRNATILHSKDMSLS
ncbi:hypothetical protein BXZ70DRAFT_1006709 [Cristinia sonorae]|uniref:Uncharacterized protein n=1 Tax=Cristinia sonorae TaxID=1940300 RepID=A0A8K0XR11_9AGAR|nr:hypothetical protein BXZ70DRAFT_1006709 [Cristinia sonorae]